MSTKKHKPKASYKKQPHPPVETLPVPTKAERYARLAEYFEDCRKRAKARAT